MSLLMVIGLQGICNNW